MRPSTHRFTRGVSRSPEVIGWGGEIRGGREGRGGEISNYPKGHIFGVALDGIFDIILLYGVVCFGVAYGKTFIAASTLRVDHRQDMAKAWRCCTSRRRGTV
jgi:hypothetical protein